MNGGLKLTAHQLSWETLAHIASTGGEATDGTADTAEIHLCKDPYDPYLDSSTRVAECRRNALIPYPLHLILTPSYPAPSHPSAPLAFSLCLLLLPSHPHHHRGDCALFLFQ